jgi:hypothetical protein
MEKAERSLWQLLLLTRNAGTQVQLTCEECFALLEYDANLLAGGAALDEVRPAVNYHLSLCSKCQSKFKEWLQELDGTQSHPHSR